MVETRKCSFCYGTIEPGTGKMYVKKDGTVLNFCSNKCHKNMIELKRVPRTTAWTEKAIAEKKIRTKSAEKTAEAKPAAAKPAEPAPAAEPAAPAEKKE